MVLEIKYLEHDSLILEKNIVLCLGFFDGLHVAHMKLIEEAKKAAKEKHLPLAVFTFSMSVKSYVLKDRHRCLTTIQDKADLLSPLEVDYLYVMQVSDELIKMDPLDFINRFLRNFNTIVVGFDFSFGYMGKGNIDLLKQIPDFETIVVDEITHNNLKIGSTRIKSMLQTPNLELVKTLLNRNYSVKGKVISGRRVGRRLGFPTANIDYVPYFLPASGVYLTKVIFEGNVYFGATNIGTKPTYFHLPLTVETYIFDLDRNLYNQWITLEFLEFLRPEQKVSSETELIELINHDVEICHQLINEKYSKE